ncbi:MAG: hypothetical protein MUE60_09850 [Candidatus Eisenbacteria bacterium]|nr:hypothetical protein [Candidatus Eisenbacteria bacterium]
MTYNLIRCEAVDVKTESGICPGLAKTVRGEVFTLGPRTPEGTGICFQAMGAIAAMKLALALTDRMDWKTKDHFDITCPHGMVTYRLSRERPDAEHL